MKPSDGSFYRYFPISQRDKNWGLYVTTVGEARIAPHTAVSARRAPESLCVPLAEGAGLGGVALVYFSSGRGKSESKPHLSVSLEPGHAFLLFPGVGHRSAPDPETGWYEHWIGFDGETAHRWRRHRFISAGNPVRNIRAADNLPLSHQSPIRATKCSRLEETRI